MSGTNADLRSKVLMDGELPRGRPMRIAQIAPLYESVPPSLYGGTERVVAYLSEALVRRGHKVTLFASGDSTAKAPIRVGYPRALRLAGLAHGADHLGPALHLPMLKNVYEHAESFDVIHSHIDIWALPLARLSPTPTVSTMHGRLDCEQMRPVYDAFDQLPFVSISDAQRRPLRHLNWAGTVHHGLPSRLFRLGDGGGGYFAFVGRVAPEKGLDRAIEIASRTGIPLKIAAKIDDMDRAYFSEVIAPMLKRPGIEFIGEINDRDKQEFLGRATALLFPIDWPEPFGLVMIEAVACGTPVIARPCGSVPEVLNSGVTGLIASSIDDLTDAARAVRSLSRAECRAEFERRFTDEVMAGNYERIYHKLIAGRSLYDQTDPAVDCATADGEAAAYQAK